MNSQCATMCYMAARSRMVGVRELRQNLSVYLARVKKGQALTVTEHGRAVAELRPVPLTTDAVGRPNRQDLWCRPNHPLLGKEAR